MQVNPRLEEVKTVVVGESFSLEFIPQTVGSVKEAVLVELLPKKKYEGNEDD